MTKLPLNAADELCQVLRPLAVVMFWLHSDQERVIDEALGPQEPDVSRDLQRRDSFWPKTIDILCFRGVNSGKNCLEIVEIIKNPTPAQRTILGLRRNSG